MRSFHNYIRYFTVTAIISSLVAFGSSAAYAVSGGDNIAQHERDKLLIYQHDMRKIEAYLNGLTTSPSSAHTGLTPRSPTISTGRPPHTPPGVPARPACA